MTSETRDDPREIAPGLYGWLESPLPTAVLSDCAVVSGWVFCRGAALTGVYVKHGDLELVLHTGIERPDVADAYPTAPEALVSGFSGFVDLVGPGTPARLEVWGRRPGEPDIRLFSYTSPAPELTSGASPTLFDLLAHAARLIAREPERLLSSETWRGGLAALGLPLRTALVPVAVPAVASVPDARSLLTATATTALRAFLSSGATLDFLPNGRPRVSVVIVLWNRAELTLRCLRSLVEQVGVPLDVILVDNQSTDGTAVLLERVRGASVLTNAENVGFTVAANQGARVARAEWLLFVNSDAELLPGCISALVATIATSASIGAVGGRLVFPDGRLQEAGAVVRNDGSCHAYGRDDDPTSPEFGFERDVDFCSGALLLTRRATFEALGGFDERYKPAYYEDVDYCVRLWARGMRVVYQPAAVALHFEFGSASSPSRSVQLQIARRAIFADAHKVWLRQQAGPEMGMLKARGRPITQPWALLVDDCLPDAAAGAGFPRAAELLMTLAQCGFHVTVYPTSRAASSSARLRFPRVETFEGWGPSRLREFLHSRRDHYDLVVVSRPHNMRFVKTAIGSDLSGLRAPAVYDAEAMTSLREIDRRALAGSPLPPDAAAAIVDEELRLSQGCAAVFAVSAEECERFARTGGPPVYQLGHALTPAPTPARFESRDGLLFVGAFDPLSPNGDAARFLISEILPAVELRIGQTMRVAIAGAQMPDTIRAFANGRVTTHPDVADLTPLYDQVRVFVAPTRYSSGIPLKVLEAASRGVPVVCTRALARQLDWISGRDLLTADTPQAFAEAIDALCSSPDRWEAVRGAALDRIRLDCDPARFHATVAGAIGAIRPFART